MPLLTPSVQLGSVQTPARQTPELQSVPTWHFLLRAQGAQTSPPQSMSVSGEVNTPSLQVGGQLPEGQADLVLPQLE